MLNEIFEIKEVAFFMLYLMCLLVAFMFVIGDKFCLYDIEGRKLSRKDIAMIVLYSIIIYACIFNLDLILSNIKIRWALILFICYRFVSNVFKSIELDKKDDDKSQKKNYPYILLWSISICAVLFLITPSIDRLNG